MSSLLDSKPWLRCNKLLGETWWSAGYSKYNEESVIDYNKLDAIIIIEERNHVGKIFYRYFWWKKNSCTRIYDLAHDFWFTEEKVPFNLWESGQIINLDESRFIVKDIYGCTTAKLIEKLG
jgi:hypothetical protein